MKLDVACGQRLQEGWWGIDNAIDHPRVMKNDLLSFPWPVDSDSVDEITCEHFIEHIPKEYRDGKELFFCFFDELYRIMKKDATARFLFPHYLSDRIHQDPTHRRVIPPSTFHYLNKNWREKNELDHYNVQCNFSWQARHHYYGDAIHDPYKESHLVNIFADTEVLLTKL